MTTYMPTPNIPLLRKLVEWVELQDSLPDIDNQWRQGDYITDPETRASFLLMGMNSTRQQFHTVIKHCGTAYCAAGFIGQLLDERYVQHDQVEGVHVSNFAAHELGLTDVQGGLLFSGSNSASMIRMLCERFAGEPL